MALAEVRNLGFKKFFMSSEIITCVAITNSRPLPFVTGLRLDLLRFQRLFNDAIHIKTI
jgi:hypothetical protein